jgi:hypothetical protein
MPAPNCPFLNNYSSFNHRRTANPFAELQKCLVISSSFKYISMATSKVKYRKAGFGESIRKKIIYNTDTTKKDNKDTRNADRTETSAPESVNLNRNSGSIVRTGNNNVRSIGIHRTQPSLKKETENQGGISAKVKGINVKAREARGLKKARKALNSQQGFRLNHTTLKR